MKFIEEVKQSANGIWEECVHGEFLTKLRSGTLDRQMFLDYIVQDSIYLRDYLKAYALAMFKSRTWRQMQVFYSVLGFVSDSENATRLQYLKDNGMTDADVDRTEKRAECAAYTKFLIDTATECDIPEILMAVMPCMFGYYEVFRKVREIAPEVLDTYYGPLVRDYTADWYDECCEVWTAFCEEECGSLPPARQANLKNIYLEGCRHELHFWEMAGKKS